jgi:hypothetical protein
MHIIISQLAPHCIIIIIRPMHACEILKLQSSVSLCWTKMYAGEETFH